MKIIAIIQARMESTRLPGKVLKTICGKPILQHIIERVRFSKYLDEIIIATSNHKADDAIERFANKYNISVYRGSQENVLQRFAECAKLYKADLIVRLTGDNTLVDSDIIDKGIETYQEEELDYLYYQEGLPIGMAVEIFRYEALVRAYKEASDKECLEHVTPYLYKNEDIFKIKRSVCKDKQLQKLRWTIDTEEDLKLVEAIYNELYPKYQEKFNLEDIMLEYNQHPEWNKINNSVQQVKVLYQGEQL